jgi:hypothetical protein
VVGTGQHAFVEARLFSFVPKPVRQKELQLRPEDEMPRSYYDNPAGIPGDLQRLSAARAN